MNKKKGCVMIFVILCLFISSCGSLGAKHADNAKVQNVRYVSDEPRIVIMSDEETVRLRYILKEEDGWLDAEPCVCTKEGDYGWDVMLDGVYYRVCNAYWYTYPRDIHSISYKYSADEEYKQAMLNENEEVMIEIYEMVTKRGDCGTSIDIFLDEYQKKTNEAIIRPLWSEDTSKDIRVSKEDTDRLRILLSLESGWEQTYQCMCIGHDELILDNVGYIIDLTDVDHQIKYCEVGKESSYCAIENENKDIVQEVYDIVGKYVD